MKRLKKIKGKPIVHAGSLDQIEDHFHKGNVADVPNGVVICKVHGCPFVDGRCPKCG